jgi:hypothetical protein
MPGQVLVDHGVLRAHIDQRLQCFRFREDNVLSKRVDKIVVRIVHGQKRSELCQRRLEDREIRFAGYRRGIE